MSTDLDHPINEKLPLAWFGNKTIPRATGYLIIEAILLTFFIICIILMITIVTWTAYVWRFYAGFAVVMAFFFIICEINRNNKFLFCTAFFHSWRYPTVCVFFLLAVVDFVLLELSDVPSTCDWNGDTSDCPILNPDENGVRVLTRTFTIICGILFIFSLLAYWERFSFICAHNDWIIAIMYLSIVGIVVLKIARWLEPPIECKNGEIKWTWHQERRIVHVLDIIVKIMIFAILFFVVMGAIVLALFGDAAKGLGSAGTTFSIFVFAFIAHIIMITPLAPGSIIDICAGFLFLSLFVENENMTVPKSYILSLAIVIVLHFSGSCAQYYVGKVPCTQIWMNRTLPPEMLAASDSVLRDANFVKVGIVGQVFMDTANGLNQGRMNMPFCIQFWSEYASIPSAISLVALGSVLAIPSFNSEITDEYSWAESAIPLVVMIASLWQMIGSSWGAAELLSSAGTVSYWTAFEKWSTVQHFYKIGYVPSKIGWENDCYQLGRVPMNSLMVNEYEANSNELSLFNIIKESRAKIETLEQSAMKSSKTSFKMRQVSALRYCRKLCKEPKDPLEQRKAVQAVQQINANANAVREVHYERIQKLLANMQERQWLIAVEPEQKIVSYFTHSEVYEDTPFALKCLFHYLVVICIVGSGAATYWYVSRPIELSTAVKEGIAVLGTEYVPFYGWIAFFIFWICVFFYYQFELISSCKSISGICSYVSTIVTCSCMKSANMNMETVFNTPDWEANNMVATPYTESTDVLVINDVQIRPLVNENSDQVIYS